MNTVTLQIAAIVDKQRRRCTIEIPDLGISCIGRDYVEAYARAVSTVTAIYYYNKEHNLTFNCTLTGSDMNKYCKTRTQFPAYVTVNC